MAKGQQRDWAQLESFEAEYAERLAEEKKRRGGSQYLDFLNELARGRDEFWADEVKARDDATRRLFALRGKILGLREKLGQEEARLLDVEKPFVTAAEPKEEKQHRVRYLADPLSPNCLYPVTFDDIRAVLGELPKEHAATVHEIRLSHQRRTGADGDWLDGEIRLHCMGEVVKDDAGEVTALRRAMGRREGGQDVERFGGSFEWEGNVLHAVWPLDAYKTFILRRVLVHEVAHGVAELPGYSDAVRRAGSVEKFCEQYAENFYRPPGRSVRLGF